MCSTFETVQYPKTFVRFWTTPTKKKLDKGMFIYGHVSIAQGEMVYKLPYLIA